MLKKVNNTSPVMPKILKIRFTAKFLISFVALVTISLILQKYY